MSFKQNKYGIAYDSKHLWKSERWNQKLKQYVPFWDITADGLIEAARPYLVRMDSKIVIHADINNDLMASVECEVELTGLPKTLVERGKITVRATGEEHERRRGSEKMDSRRFVVRMAETAARKRALKLALGFSEYDFNEGLEEPTQEEEGTPLDKEPQPKTADVPEPYLSPEKKFDAEKRLKELGI